MNLSLADLRAFASRIARRLDNEGMLTDDTTVAAATTPVAEELAAILANIAEVEQP